MAMRDQVHLSSADEPLVLTEWRAHTRIEVDATGLKGTQPLADGWYSDEHLRMWLPADEEMIAYQKERRAQELADPERRAAAASSDYFVRHRRIFQGRRECSVPGAKVFLAVEPTHFDLGLEAYYSAMSPLFWISKALVAVMGALAAKLGAEALIFYNEETWWALWEHGAWLKERRVVATIDDVDP
jgi:hypothetical protein